MGEIIDSHIFIDNIKSIEELRHWFQSQGVSKILVCKAVYLLDRLQVEVEPRPTK